MKFWITQFGLGLQFAVLSIASAILVVLVVRAAGVDAQIGADVVAMTLIVQGAVTILMGTRLRLFGAAQPLPIAPAVTYIAASLKAVTIGGLPLVFGMTLFAGLLQMLFTPLLRLSQHVVSTQIGELLLLIIGFDTVYFGIRGIVNGGGVDVALALGTLLFIYVLKIWGWKPASRLSILWAILFGYLAAYFLGALPEGTGASIAAAPWFRLPRLLPGGISFSWTLIVPFTVAAIVSSVRMIGALAAMQRIERPELTEPDMQNVSRGNMTDGLGTALAGGLGGIGIGISASATAIALESRLTQRRLAWVAGGIAIAVGLVYKASALVISIPISVMSGVLIYLGISIIQSHIPTLARAMERRRSAVYLALALLFALAQPVFPMLLGQLPHGIQLFTGSGIAIACLLAILFRLLARVRLKDDQLGR